MTYLEQAAPGQGAGFGSREILDALARAGRWQDAADFYPQVEDAQPVVQARLFLAAGRLAEAHAILLTLAEGENCWFERTVDEVLHGDLRGLPDLVVVGSKPTTLTILSVLMMRAAHAGGRADLATHYAKQVLAAFPGDTDAACVVALEAIEQGNYVSAVGVLDRVEAEQAADSPTPLQTTLGQLGQTGTPAQINALVTFGRAMHREEDPTLPVTRLQKEARDRWSAAYRAAVPQTRRIRLTQWALLVIGLAVTVAVANVVPVILVGLALGLWLRRRRLSGLDAAMSRWVRQLHDPFQFWRTRNYRVADALTGLVVVVIGAFAVAKLPIPSSRGDYVKALAVIAATVLAVRARRRWVRRDRRRRLGNELEPTGCRCQTAQVYRGRANRSYVAAHLSALGDVPGTLAEKSGWTFRECPNTHARFLDLPRAEVTIRLDP